MSAASITPLVTEPVAAPIDRPEYRVYDHPLTLEGVKLRPGVWYHGNKEDKATGDRLPFVFKELRQLVTTRDGPEPPRIVSNLSIDLGRKDAVKAGRGGLTRAVRTAAGGDTCVATAAFGGGGATRRRPVLLSSGGAVGA